MTRQPDEPKPLEFDGAPARTPGRLAFDAPPADPSRPAERPAPKALDLGPAPERHARTAPADVVGRALFGESNHPLLEQCFRVAQTRFPNLYPDCAPRIERHIRQLVPLKLASVATIGDGALESAGNLVEAVAATTREFNELGAADLMADLLAQATRKAGMLERWFRPSSGHVDYRAALGALKQSLGFFPRRTEELAVKARHAEESLVVALAALSAVADVVRAPDDPGLERTLFDRRNIVGQAVQQIRMQPALLRGLDERVTDLLSRADHLMNVVLPAAVAARPRG
ncbi:hypothetical protein [Burkholderia ubonensis]|uniref:Uncharacterized protein n=1 Tax=Burkholderia ubonensis subsp. mesacidophila TaxID=265293 RepID=A0A2A4EN40_9BURK|nr:hypothetical protein [Burkholderia ubonensis]PCE21529.1 hypothetical protein BZL54_35455 [Burkholderia ubonensis subsp. mesacidophila]